MSKLPVCPYCHKEIQVNEPKKAYKTRHYHTSCYKKFCEEIYNQNQANADPKEQLYGYICTLFDISELTPFLTAQLRKFESDYNMTYDGMWFSLKYYFEILGNKVDKRKGIGIIPYIYDEAKAFYQKVTFLKEKNKDKPNVPETKVKVQAGRSKSPKKQIDINKL